MCNDQCSINSMCIDGKCMCLEGYHGKLCDEMPCPIPDILNNGYITNLNNKR